MTKIILIPAAIFVLFTAVLTGCIGAAPTSTPTSSAPPAFTPKPSSVPVSSATPGAISSPALQPVQPSKTNVPTGGETSTPGIVPLKITQPADAATIRSATVEVRGLTVPGATVMVNDEIGEADDSGNFSITVNLESGPNAIVVTAFDDNGHESEIILLVNAAI